MDEEDDDDEDDDEDDGKLETCAGGVGCIAATGSHNFACFPGVITLCAHVPALADGLEGAGDEDEDDEDDDEEDDEEAPALVARPQARTGPLCSRHGLASVHSCRKVTAEVRCHCP